MAIVSSKWINEEKTMITVTDDNGRVSSGNFETMKQQGYIPEDFDVLTVADWKTPQEINNEPILQQIAELEAKVTARRQREALIECEGSLLSKPSHDFIKDIDQQIAVLRAQLI